MQIGVCAWICACVCVRLPVRPSICLSVRLSICLDLMYVDAIAVEASSRFEPSLVPFSGLRFGMSKQAVFIG